MRQRPCFLLYAALALFVGSSHQCLGVLANAWHIPNNTSDLGFNMRNPAFEIGASTTTSNQATAAGSPFTIRNRPAWLFDAGNRVISPGSDASPSNLDSIASACCRNDPVRRAADDCEARYQEALGQLSAVGSSAEPM